MCTRTVFTADDGRVVTGRNMDWAEDMDTDLWAFAAGIERTGERGPRALTWTSAHSTVIAAAYDSSTIDGINDAGLVGNLLFLAESDVGESRDRVEVGAMVAQAGPERPYERSSQPDSLLVATNDPATGSGPRPRQERTSAKRTRAVLTRTRQAMDEGTTRVIYRRTTGQRGPDQSMRFAAQLRGILERCTCGPGGSPWPS